MANPFALVSVGCCYLFLFLSLCTASCSPYLHLVQTALSTARWFALADDSRNHRSIDAAGASGSNVNDTRRRRRQWDPGITPMPRLIRSPRRVWDPGIRLAFSPMMASLYDCNNFALTVATGTTVRALSILTMPSAMVLPANMLHYHHPVFSWDTLRPMPPAAPTVDRDPFLRPTRPTVSMFQHCHPVLSRPTVPNII